MMFKSHFLALTLAALAIGAPLNPLKRQIIPTDEELCIPNCYPHQGPHKPGGVFIPKRSASDTQLIPPPELKEPHILPFPYPLDGPYILPTEPTRHSPPEEEITIDPRVKRPHLPVDVRSADLWDPEVDYLAPHYARRSKFKRQDTISQPKGQLQGVEGDTPQQKGQVEGVKGDTPQPKGEIQGIEGDTPQPKGQIERVKGDTPQRKGQIEGVKGDTPQPKGETQGVQGVKCDTPQPKGQLQGVEGDTPQPKGQVEGVKGDTPQPKGEIQPNKRDMIPLLKAGSVDQGEKEAYCNQYRNTCEECRKQCDFYFPS